MKDNVPFFIAVALLLILLLGIFLNARYKKTNYYQNSIFQVQKFCKGVPEHLNIVNTGSSYARYGFDYDITELHGFNFGLQPQSLVYDFKILKHYRRCLADNCIVLITLPDLVFGFLDYADDSTNTKYYHFLNPEEINGYKTLKKLYRITFPLLSAPKRGVIALFNDVPKNDEFSQTANCFAELQVDQCAQKRIDGWVREFGLTDIDAVILPEPILTIFPQTVQLLNKMIAYCLKEGLRPILITPPVSAALGAKLSAAFLKKFLYDNVEQANTFSIPYWNYSSDQRFQDYRLYLNADFLNQTGRRKFTQVVLGDLSKAGYLSE